MSTEHLPARPADHPLLPDQFDPELLARLAALDTASDTHAQVPAWIARFRMNGGCG